MPRARVIWLLHDSKINISVGGVTINYLSTCSKKDSPNYTFNTNNVIFYRSLLEFKSITTVFVKKLCYTKGNYVSLMNSV